MSRTAVKKAPAAPRPACVLFVGGVRSGKSGLAQRWAEARSPWRLYVATCAPGDAEMAERVRLHKAARGPEWACLEVPLDVPEALDALWVDTAPEAGVVLLDCVSMWVSNLLAAGLDDAGVLARVEALAASLERRTLPVAVVTAETGLGLVPPSPLARRFLDVLGLANQRLACLAEPVVLAVCGLPPR